MAKNTQPIAKRCRALGISPAVMGYGKKTTNRNPGGQMRKKKSEYATQLNEKQKVKFVYGILENQFHTYYEKASRMPGQTGVNLLVLVERRLDNVVYRLGFAKTRRDARQDPANSKLLQANPFSSSSTPADSAVVASAQHCSTTFISWRTLPGQSCCCSRSSASGAKPVMRRCSRGASTCSACRASMAMSSRRSRKGGRCRLTTLRR